MPGPIPEWKMLVRPFSSYNYFKITSKLSLLNFKFDRSLVVEISACEIDNQWL